MIKKKFLLLIIFCLHSVTFFAANYEIPNDLVIKAAQKALDENDINSLLIWLPKTDETKIKGVFDKTLYVRKLGPEAKELADTYFLETCVRMFRVSQGLPYTGIKPTNQSNILTVAEKSVDENNPEPAIRFLHDALATKIKEEYRQVTTKKRYPKDNIAQGREYIKAYTDFLRSVQEIYNAIQSTKTEEKPK